MDYDSDEELRSWVRSLRSKNRSPRTVDTYVDSVVAFHRWWEANRKAALRWDRVKTSDIEDFVTDVLQRSSPATASIRYRSIRQFFKHMLRVEDIERDPMETMSPPKVVVQPVEVIEDGALERILATCRSKDADDIRDRAILLMLFDTGMRRSELLGLTTADVDLDAQTVRVLGKGGRERVCPMGDASTEALERWLKARRKLSKAHLPALWLARRQERLGESGLATMLRRRGERAGVGRLHPHAFRHTFAHTWLAEGGNEGDLMRLAGWSSRDMLDRYGRSAADSRARAAHKHRSPADRAVRRNR